MIYHIKDTPNIMAIKYETKLIDMLYRDIINRVKFLYRFIVYGLYKLFIILFLYLFFMNTYEHKSILSNS